ncbi:unnamed protein product [Mytilus edulis]|uniref:HAT C-terminal dimerisation domain-containing protein n=1 Tax=Mytilus edulis TaxID=6550 RepID=A0A8S3SVV9_MYTED|nr:unnamed protein product [Mytilus edulis]
MGDVMGIVCRVSRVFQREDLTFSVIKDVIDPACAAILGMKSTAGPELESFLSEVPSEVQESGNFLFGGNLIKDSPSQRSNFESLRVKFIDQLVLNLKSRFPSQQIFQSLSIFDPQFVPSAGSQELLSYGKEQVDFLCKHFGQDKGGHKALISEVHFREEWLMFKQVLPGYKGVRMDSALSSLLCKDSFAVDYPNVANFLSICLVSALSSVDCERGFSRYNLTEKVPYNNKPGRKILNVNRLKELEIKQKCVMELRNRFLVLEEIDPTEDNSIEKKWENIKEVYQNTSEKIIGFRKSSNKQCLTSDTWKAIDERAKLKEKVLSTRSSRLKEQTQKEYAEKDKEVKKRARKDKRNHLEERAEEAEKAVARGDLSTVYKITKELCGQSKQPPQVKDKNGKIITTEREQAARWVEHFKSVLDQSQ